MAAADKEKNGGKKPRDAMNGGSCWQKHIPLGFVKQVTGKVPTELAIGRQAAYTLDYRGFVDDSGKSTKRRRNKTILSILKEKSFVDYEFGRGYQLDYPCASGEAERRNKHG